jgi:hypothetical protein
VAVVALAVRQSLALVRRAQAMHGTGQLPPVDALRSAAREQAAPVIISVLVTAALFLPAALMGGGAGLEILQPFAVALLCGLVTSTLVVLFLVPSLFAATGALRPSPVIGPDTPDGEPDEAASPNFAVRPRPHDNSEVTVDKAGAAMKTVRSYGIASLFVAAGLGLAGCQTASAGSDAEEAIAAAASVEPDPDGGPARLTLTSNAIERLRLETSPVADGGGGLLLVPYAAVIYDADGATWAFVELEEQVFQREHIEIAAVNGDQVWLTAGPPAGTEVVTVAAAELVGVEAGISGGE